MMVPGLSDVPAMPLHANELIANATKEQYDMPPTAQGKRSGLNSVKTIGIDGGRTDQRPIGQRPDQYSEPKRSSEQEILHSPNFNAKHFISSSLSGATDVEISKFSDRLIALQEKLLVDRKDMIYGNYKTFLTVGTQISVLGTELKSLRKLVNDFHVATTAIKEDAELYLANSAQENSTKEESPENGMGSNSHRNSLNGLFPSRGLQPPGRQNNRNSVLMLEGMWQQELTSLFKAVEGAQKYLPAAPGRHVLLESAGWYQLHAATWKPLQPIHVVLLNDHLLVATKKRHRNEASLTVQSTQSLVAEICWPLTEIQIEDLSLSGPDAAGRNIPLSRVQNPGQRLNGFLVVAGNMSYVYKTDIPDALSKVMAAYKRAIRELRKSSGTQPIIKNRMGDGSGRGLEEVKSNGHKRHMSVDFSERARNLREVDDIINDLDVKIAHRKFNDAVTIIRRCTKELGQIENMPPSVIAAAQNAPATLAAGGNLSAPAQRARKGSIAPGANPTSTSITAIDIKTLRAQLLKVKIDLRTKELADILLADITQEFIGPSKMKNYMQLLIQLGQSDAVKKTFLGSRRQLIRNRAKVVEFKGDIPGYIAQIATIQFRMIRTTVDIYQACYPKKENASSIVEWAKAEVEDFVVMFARQLYNIEPKSPIYVKCADITREQSIQLKEVGLNLDFLLDYIYEGTQKK